MAHNLSENLGDDAISWHSEIAQQFNDKYQNKQNFIDRYALLTTLIEKYSDAHSLVFDLGCGSGNLALFASDRNCQTIGFDASHDMLKIARQKMAARTTLEFIHADFYDIAKQISQQADLIICSSVIEYLDDIELAFSQLRNLVKDNGTIIFTLPNIASIYRKLERMAYRLFGIPKYYRYVINTPTQSAILDLLARHQFQVLETHYFALPPLLNRFNQPLANMRAINNLTVFVAKAQSKR